MIKKYLLFTMPACPNCHLIKDFFNEKDRGVEGEEVDASTDKGTEKAVEFNVMSTPTVIFIDENGKEVSRVFSVEEVKKVVENKSLTDV